MQTKAKEGRLTMGYNKRYYKDKARKKRIKKRKADFEN